MKHRNFIKRGGILLIVTAIVLISGFFVVNVGTAKVETKEYTFRTTAYDIVNGVDGWMNWIVSTGQDENSGGEYA